MSYIGRWFGFDSEEICEEGLRALDRKEYAAAARAFEACLESSSREATIRLTRFHLAECYFQLAQTAFRRAEYEEAWRQIERSFVYASPTVERHLLAARIARRLEERNEAWYHIDRALAQAPDSPEAIALRTAAYYEDGRTEEAMAQARSLAADDRMRRFEDAHRRGDRTAAVGHLLALASDVPAASLL